MMLCWLPWYGKRLHLSCNPPDLLRDHMLPIPCPCICLYESVKLLSVPWHLSSGGSALPDDGLTLAIDNDI